MTFLEVALWFGGAATIVTSSGLLWRVLFRPVVAEVRDHMKDHDEIAAIVPTVKQIAPVVAQIAAEFKTDSGLSIKDVVDEIGASAREAKVHAEQAVRTAARTATDTKTQLATFEKHITEKFVVINKQLVEIQTQHARRREEFTPDEGGSP